MPHNTRTRPLAERFWEKVAKAGPTQCWLWTGASNSTRYGRMSRGAPSREIVLAHRVSYELHNGPIPNGLWVLHHCDNPPCVNPAHLFLGDQKANMQDAKAKGRAVDPPHRQGEAHHSAKLTEEQVRSARRRIAAGETHASIATSYGVSTAAISLIAMGRNWKHLA